MPDVRLCANEKAVRGAGKVRLRPAMRRAAGLRLRANGKAVRNAEKIRLRLRGDHSAAEEKPPRAAREARNFIH